MSFFSSFPVIPYDSIGNYNFKDVTNILRRVLLRAMVKENVSIFDTYDVKEGETPEIIADKLYGDPELHYVVLMVNDITDRYHQWPMNFIQFRQYVEDKYDDPNGIHHYEVTQSSGNTTKKIWVENDVDTNPDGSLVIAATATAVTNFEYEQRLQDDRRRIRLLDPTFVDLFVTEFENRIGESII